MIFITPNKHYTATTLPSLNYNMPPLAPKTPQTPKETIFNS